MRRLNHFAVLVAVTLLIVPSTALAIPAFARKHGFNCNMCHVAYPKLNDFGQRFRDNGYQIPGQEGGEETVFDGHLPISLRTTTGLAYYDVEDGSTLGFNIFGLDVLAAGVMHENISFLFIYTPRIDEPAADYSGSEDASNPAQTATLESVNLVFSNVVQGAINLRVGRYEPAYHPLSSKRKYYIFAPYEVYAFAPPSNSFVFDDNQIGVEATGHFRRGFKYAAGVVNGTGANPDNNRHKDLYLTLSQTFGPGDGQSAGQRIDLFGYYGWQPAELPGAVIAPTGETDGTCNSAFYRVGVSASLNWKTFNVQALFMNGVDDKELNSLSAGEDYTYTGGLVQIDWAGLANNRLVASGMYNWVKPPDYDAERQVDAFSALLRYYLGGWKAVNIAVHTEYTYRETGKDEPFKENELAVIFDFDF